jgi:dCMP deaminase
MKEREKQLYMDFAHRVAEMSYAVRLRVGAVIAREHNILSYGWNGMPAGWDNTCEEKVWATGDEGGWLGPEEIQEMWPFEELVHEPQPDETVWSHYRRYKLVTKPEVLHAERNALDKLAKGRAAAGATLFVTHSPCIECAKSIYSAGITTVYYENLYRSDDGIKFLKKCGVTVEKFGDS